MESACEPGFVPTCGQTPNWACTGDQPACTDLPPVCGHDMGCIEAAHPVNEIGPAVCHAIHAAACDRCGGEQDCVRRGQVREGGDCGWCVAETVCR